MLFLDTETFSETPIKNGTYRYLEDAEVMIVTYAFDNGPVQCWDVTASQLMPNDLSDYLDGDGLISCHNSVFDRNVLKYCLGYDLPVERFRCTMVKAYLHGLPGKLDLLSDIFKLSTDAKDKRGKALIHLFCKPRKFSHDIDRDDYPDAKSHKAAVAAAKAKWVGRATSKTHPKEWQEFIEYAKSDITALRRLDNLIPKWNITRTELAYWHLDQRRNDRGVAIDIDLAEAALRAVDKEQRTLKDATQELTGFDGEGEGLESTSKRDKMLQYMLEAYGVTLPDLKMDTILRRLDDPDLPIELKELLKIRLQVSTTSTSKYKSMLKAVNDDGRVRGLIQFAGAFRTGRDAGRTVQPQNFPSRDLMDIEDIERGIKLLKLDSADLMYDDIMRLTSSCLRQTLVAAPGKKIIAADLSNIEGRYLSWAAGEEWKIQAFRDFDQGLGPDLYKLAYAKSFSMDHEDVTKAERQVGKVMELACFASKTKVLTNNGVKDIVAVSINDLLWDGTQWVKHQGLVEQGVQKVVRVAGIKLTPEHLVLTNQTWTQAHLLGTNPSILDQALASGSENLPWLATSRGLLGGLGLLKSSARAVPNRIASKGATFVKGQARGALGALRSRLTIGVKTFGDMQLSYPTMDTDVGYVTEYRPVSTDAGTQTTKGTPTTEAEVSRSTRLGLRTEAYFWRTWLLLTAGMYQAWSLTEQTLIKGMNRVTCGLLQSKKILETSAKSKTYNGRLTHYENVYDIALAGTNNRFTIVSSKGPLIVHNCGFEGGVGSYLTFATAYGLDLDEMARVALSTIPKDIVKEAEGFYGWTIKMKRSTFGLSKDAFVTCDSFKRMWREAHPNIVNLWRGLGDGCRDAIQNPGDIIVYGKFKMQRTGQWLRLLMPSGRALCYPYPKVDDQGGISFMGSNIYTRKWERIKTHGGKLVENITQAGARDVFKHGELEASKVGYDTIFPVHDELVTETPNTPEYSVAGLVKAMTIVPPWAKGLPLAADGFEALRYRK